MKWSKNATEPRANKKYFWNSGCRVPSSKKKLMFRVNNHFDKTVFRYHNTVVISLTVIFFFRGCVIWVSIEITLVLFCRHWLGTQNNVFTHQVKLGWNSIIGCCISYQKILKLNFKIDKYINIKYFYINWNFW